VTLLSGAAAAILLLAGGLTAQASDQDLLPDLGMKRLGNIHVEKGAGEERLLRFATTIVNVGAGAFEVTGRRSDASVPDMSVTQNIYDSAGRQRSRSTTATIFYARDGHEHWHVRDLEEYELFRSSDARKVGTGAKVGFCFYDNQRHGAETAPFYLGCENNNPDALRVTMGLSRGWGDRYGSSVVGQYIDITGLPDGRYRLRATADKAGWFLEEDESNNFTWTDLRINGSTVTVLEQGPTTPPIR
jgi:hypothetical protein